ncbi:winged helix-turn-helix domain-containing tetratricopeptide repeat protein [Kineobactrum salinum]|uniref:OmpR/PhoB-type domain-containing protein n=1 Tax=Kineobactrum salinum TaxID=2708301 RepID=A0A6C0U273_9GAMM|nr:winged helix-turn-helix domain-containing protein [Kineobactrum salinum]QIB66126.1 hypothetical protein G3T16_12615 [Kineobactrum salinum]
MTLKRVFRLGDWEVLPLEGRIVRDGQSERLRPKAMDILCLLAASPGEVIERDTILGEIWGRTAVTDEPLTATVGELRRVLGDRREAPVYIETIPKRGYRLLAPVTLLEEAPPAAATGPAPSIRRPKFWLPALLALLLAAVLSWQAGNPPPPAAMAPPGSLAVLPFRVLGNEEVDRYFGDGLAQEILTTLSRLRELRVAARSSAFEFRDRGDALQDIREALNVDAVLEGSIRREGERVRIQAQLTDTRSGYLLWADTYDRPLDDAFILQSDIALAIADHLSVALTEARRLAPNQGQADSGAYLAYLHGRYLYETSRDEAGLQQARQYLETALEQGSDLATARAALAGVWARMADFGFVRPSTAYEQARVEAERAIAQAPELGEAHLVLGWIRLYHDWDWDGARDSLSRALELNPGDAFTISANAALHYHLAQLERAVLLAEMAVERDPLRASSFYNLAYFRYAAADFEGAEQALERVEALVPDYPRAGLLRVQIDLERNDVAAAASRVESHPLLSLMASALVAAAQGDRQTALAALAEMERDHAETSPTRLPRFICGWATPSRHLPGWSGH